MSVETPGAEARPRMTQWGIADDGTAVEITVEGAMDLSRELWWPSAGLTWSETRPVGAVMKRIVISDSKPAVEPRVIIDGSTGPGGWNRVESELAIFAADRLSGLVAIHAAVLATPKGLVIVPGPSHCGKSTLCVAAAARGIGVLSDEYALADPRTGLVVGWRRPVRIRRDDGTVDRLDLAVDSKPLPVIGIAFVPYAPDQPSSWSSIATSDAAMGLMANAVSARTRPDMTLDAVLAVTSNALAIAGVRDDATSALPRLLAHFGVIDVGD